MQTKKKYPLTDLSTDQSVLVSRLAGPMAARGISSATFREILADANFKIDSIIEELLDSGERKIRVQLHPILIASNRYEYEQGALQAELILMRNTEERHIGSALAEEFFVEGFCIPCNQQAKFLVDLQAGGYISGGKITPNWRERLECTNCHMNNRQRLVATLVSQELEMATGRRVYFMEKVTPIYRWAVQQFGEHEIIGSEYLGYQYTSGQVINGIRHENIESLSFADDELDLIVSNDVFEHVPNPMKAFSECARVLKKNGVMIAAVPFRRDLDVSVSRAKLVDGNVIHDMSPVYHGNPVSEEGSLVFTDFGWDILNTFRLSGFASASLHVYVSRDFAHLGSGQLIFYLKK